MDFFQDYHVLYRLLQIIQTNTKKQVSSDRFNECRFQFQVIKIWYNLLIYEPFDVIFLPILKLLSCKDELKPQLY